LRRTRVLDQTELARPLPVLQTTHRPHGLALLLMLLALRVDPKWSPCATATLT